MLAKMQSSLMAKVKEKQQSVHPDMSDINIDKLRKLLGHPIISEMLDPMPESPSLLMQ